MENLIFIVAVFIIFYSISKLYDLPITFHPSVDKWLKEGTFKLLPSLNEGRFDYYDDVFPKKTS